MRKQFNKLALALVALVAGGIPGALAQTLIHRYSFNDTPGNTTFADSAGGSSWDGTLVGTASLDGSQLQLDGNSSFGLLPGGMVSGETQVTIEFWASFGTENPVWTRTFSFGDQDGSGNKVTGLDFCHYAGGNWQNLGFTTPAANVWANNPGGLNGVTNVHVTAIVDPVNNRMYYYNGTKITSNPGVNNGTVPPLSGLVDTFGLIGRSLFDIDATLVGSIDEFRVYSGVVSSQQVALNQAAGPDVYVTDPGTLQAVHLQSPNNTILVNQLSTQVFTGDFANLSGVDLIAYGGANFASGNEAVLTVDTNGVVKGVAPGTTTVIASYGALSATNTLSVIALPPELKHRYSFTSDASDSVGNANGTLQGAATISGGKVVLDGSSGTYVDLPGPAINLPTNKAVTIQAWVDFGDVGTWSRLWDFGHDNATSEIYFAPRVGNGGRHRLSENYSGGPTINWEGTLSNQTALVTAVIDPPSGTLAVYRNGTLEHALFNASAPLSLVSNTMAVLGRSLVAADPYMPGAIDEFRIYSGVLSPAAIAMTYANGPASAAFDPGALQSIEVVPMVYPSLAGRMPPMILANYANFTGFNLLPNNSAVVSGLTLTSSDTNVIMVLANNMVQTFGPGKATLTATYGGKESSAEVMVGNVSQLTHRYSFNGNFNDSVGSATGTPIGNATVADGQLVLDGSSAPATYLELPGGLMKDYSALTVDAWVNFNAGANWARLWYFGNDRADEFYIAPVVNASAQHRYSAGLAYNGSNMDRDGAWENLALHVTAVYGDGTMAVYTNGILNSGITVNGRPELIGEWFSWIGRSPYPDPYMNCTVDEFRIYNGRLSPQEILASEMLGPNTLLSVAPPMLAASAAGGDILLKWPVEAAGFIVQSSQTLATGSWAPVTNAPALVGSEWQMSIPAGSGAQFFRLWR